MTDHQYNSRKYFLTAVILSVTLHGLILGVSQWLPAAPRFSVLEAPNTLEVNVLEQPVVTVVEKAIITREVMIGKATEDFVVHDREIMDRGSQQVKPTIVSQKSQGAVSAVRPLMYVNPAPVYPRMAREHGWEGTVRLDVLVEQNGHSGAIEIEQSSGHKILDDSAVATVRNWKFTPARFGAMRVSSKIIIPIQFTILRE